VWDVPPDLLDPVLVSREIVLATDGAFSDDGTFHPLANWNTEAT